MYDLAELQTRTVLLHELYTPVVGDVMDAMGFFHQFLPASIKPMLPDQKLLGFAMPVLMMDVFGHQERPFGRLTQALDDLRPGEVYVAGGAMHRSANWGELLTATAKTRGAVGAVVDGHHRDTPQVLAQNFPVFSIGTYAQDSGPRMKVAEFRVCIEIGGVSIVPGDLIFGDVDGVLVIPGAAVQDVIAAAYEKAKAEKTVRKAIENGMSATEAFEKYGVL
jgi:4-hydroxy-4-methyl-2-oxoglutarate aldolase